MKETKGKNNKLVFVTARLPYPASSGRKNVMYNYCKILHEVYGYDIYVISFLEEGDMVEAKPAFIKEVVKLENVCAKKKLFNLLIKTFLTKQYPMQVSLYFDDKILNQVNSYIKSIQPDVVIADMVRTTEYLRKYKGYKIADLDDLISIRYERQLEMDIKEINPYGAYLYSLPAMLQSLLSISAIKRYILKNETKLLKKYEKEISADYDKTVFVAQNEADILNYEMKFNKAMSVPLGVDIDYFGEFNNKLLIQDNTIAFLGAMSVAHNEAGALHFINNIFPIIQQKNPKAKFVIVGGGVTQKVKDLAKNNERIVFTGRVEDVRIHVGACTCFVCPLTFGSGIKTKNLEAMAMGVPVVTTSIGAENINAINGKDWLIADDVQTFANHVLNVLNDRCLHDKLARNGYSFVDKYFTWRVAEEKIVEMLPGRQTMNSQ